jgi:hypothetical protein
MSEDIAKGRTVCFLFVDAESLDDFSLRVLEEPTNGKLILARSCSDSEMVILEAGQTNGRKVSIASFLDDFMPDIVRIHNPSSIHMLAVELSRHRKVPVHYDIMDDWDSFSRQPWGTSTSDWFIKNADIKTCVSQFISAQAYPTHIDVIPNAVTETFIARCRSKPRQQLFKDRPSVVYIGALWPDWIDWELIDRMVHALPTIDFIFIGALTGPINECHSTGSTGSADRLVAVRPNTKFISEIDHCEIGRASCRERVS